MDKQIITFSANEQNLVRIGGEYHYSSNKVSYIGAHFDLGTNWDGFDSVRAVWFTDRINGISTVLDGEGNCTVPTEVLKKKDRVFVNLVGSIVSNGELTDRLTTYPAVALVVDSKAKVDSTETAPVTPSQFEQFVSIVQDAVANIKDIVSTTLNADYTLTFVYSDGTSYTTPSIRGERGPQGADGADGTDGNGIASAVLNSNYTLTLTFTDGTSYTTPSIRGAQGPKGDPGDVSQAQLDAAVSDLKSDLTLFTGNYAIQFSDPTLKQYIPTNGATVDWSNPSTSSSTNIKWAVIECSEGDIFIINGKGGNADRLWAFADANKNILSNAIPNLLIHNLRLVAPQNAKYLIINDEINEQSYVGDFLVDSVDAIKADVDNIGEKLAMPITPRETTFFYNSYNLVDPTETVDGEYVNPNTGAFIENESYKRTGYVPIEGDKDYYITNVNDLLNYNIFYVFYDGEKHHLDGAGIALSSVGGVIHSPVGSKYIVVSSSASFPFMVTQSSVAKPFEAYDTSYILPKYIVEEDVSSLEMNIPSKIYALSGYELNIYFENIVEDWRKYQWDVSCSKGKQMERGYTITPTDADVGNYPLTLTARISESVFKSVQTTLVIASSNAGSGDTKSIIILGDSTTDNGTAVAKLNENFSNDVMNINTLGTRGTTPNNEEGRSGWTFNDYFTKASSDGGSVLNPFFNPNTQTFDASYYFNNSGIAKPDWFFINLGINDMFGYSADTSLMSGIETAINRCDSMIESIKTASPNTKIGICITIPPNSSQDAFGKAYGCNYKRNRYKRNNALWANRLIEEYDGKESDSIYVVPINTNLDTIYNMGLEETPVNARNTITYESPIANGGVHPATSGYWQIADVYTAFLKANA